MNKKTNTVLFLLGATIVNVFIILVCLGALLFLYTQFLSPSLPMFWLPVILAAAMALSFVLYRILLKQVLKRVDITKHFEPIFGFRRAAEKKAQDESA